MRVFIIILVYFIPVSLRAQKTEYPTIYTGYENDLYKYYSTDTIANTWELFSLNNGEKSNLSCKEIPTIYKSNEKNYHKVVVGETDTLLYRQDGNKVFLLNDGQDILILNYGLSIEDTFISPEGDKFEVKEIVHLKKDSYNTYWRYDDKLGILTFSGETEPRILLLSTENGNTDVWIEGIGSIYWGIIPPYIQQKLNSCSKESSIRHVITSECWNVVGVNLNINEDYYKKVFFECQGSSGNNDVIPMEYEFLEDTLYLHGTSLLASGICFVECDIKNNFVDIILDNKYYATSDKGNRVVNLKIPDFKAGTYEVGLAGKEHVTLVCDGANGVEHISETLRHENQKGGVYDLSGRRVDAKAYENEKLKKGIYIKDGRKLMVR